MIIHILLIILLFTSNIFAEEFQIDLFKADGNFCSLDNRKDNKNDPCSPESIDVKPKDTENTSNNIIVTKQKNKEKIPKKEPTTEVANTKPKQYFDVNIVFFYGEECPHCKEQKPFLQALKDKYKSINIHSFEVWHNRENALLLERFAKAYGVKSSGVPITFIGSKVIIGFSESIKKDLQEIVLQCLSNNCVNPFEIVSKNSLSPSETMQDKEEVIDIPLIGKINLSKMTLPLMTIVIAGLDSFNPCAFFVLLSLLGLMIHARSRVRMLIIGGIFVFFSGFIYFVFMSAWLNFFLIMGEVAIITTVAGLISVTIAIINIKDFFVFKKGVSLTISDEAKSKLFDKMRRLLRSTSIVYMVFGTIVLAITANAYELLCTAGFPMVFTRILTLNNLPTIEYYLYLVLYNIVYVVPLTIIVLIFTVTLGKRQLTEKEGRILKLLSGMMMMGLGLVLLFKPALLNNVFASIAILSSSLLITFLFYILVEAKNKTRVLKK